MQLKLSKEMPDIPEIKKPRGWVQKRKAEVNFRKTDCAFTCDDCKNLKRISGYRKCPNIIGFSHCQSTDINRGYICDRFKEKF